MHPIFKFSPRLLSGQIFKFVLAASLTFWSTVLVAQSPSKVKESIKVFKTYPFSDPDPIPRMGNIYPYFRFDGYTDKAIDKSWKVVELENDYLSVMILPEIGGKIWSATEKSTGKNFLYYNHVVKFRDIAMRGPWTSGGIEANYGIIGHTPNCATPVDYLTRTNADGSVSCFIGTLDLLTRTYWTIEINLPKDKAYFTTKSFWSNTTAMEQPYYTWMNVGLKAAGNLEFIYPGTRYLGHDGSNHAWPIHEGNGKNISFYEQNNFGPYKSYHVFGKYTDFFGAYWHNENFGMGRYAPHDEKAGKKIWIWGLSQQGMIWEKLLSDTDGQYVEVQSGRLYNQTDHTSSVTPFKHRGFAPHSTDTWTEHWFPVKGTHGFVTAGPAGAMNVRSRNGYARIDLCPLGAISEKLVVTQGDRKIYEKTLSLKTLQVFTDSVSILTTIPFVVTLGDHLLDYNSDPKDGVLARPLESPSDFDWNSLQGLYVEGKEFIRERQYLKAEEKLKQCLAKDPNYLPALADLGMLSYRNIDYTHALEYLMKALSIDTYHPQANFYYGLTQAALGKETDARDGLDIAAQDPAFRAGAYTELGRLELKAGRLNRAEGYARKSLEGNSQNVDGYQLLAVIARLRKDSNAANESLAALRKMNPLNHFANAEDHLRLNTSESGKTLVNGIRNELAVETYLELASWYFRLDRWADAQAILALAPANAEVLYWQAYMEKKLGGSSDKLDRATRAPLEGVFPFRAESATVLAWATGATDSWRPVYFLGLIYWNKNQLSKARELFMACGNRPEFSPFYAARAELVPETSAKDLRKASELHPNQWRYGKQLILRAIEEKKYAEALKTAQDYDSRLPNDFRIRLLLAKANLLGGKYAACVDVLNATKVLPYEGSTEGHALYREALLMQTLERLKAKKYAEALALVTKARGYPENLGVGKPYDENIDSRVESFLEGLCHEGLKKPDQAKASWSALTSQNQVPGINNLVTAWAFRKQGKAAEGEAMLKAWSSRASGPLPTWCLDIYENKASAWEPGAEVDGSRVVRELVLLVR
jgi:Tfp pilus assembly protein PilF